MRPAFTVIWKRSLLDQTIPTMLVSEMEQGRGIAQVTEALNLVDRLLGARPETEGESRGNDERVLICPPLVVVYEVYPDEHIACVRSVRLVRGGEPTA